jgi:hypothetical protein
MSNVFFRLERNILGIEYSEKYARMIGIDEEACSDVYKKLLGTKNKEQREHDAMATNYRTKFKY